MGWLSNLSRSANCTWNVPSDHISASPHSPFQPPLHSNFRISKNSCTFTRLCFYINTSSCISKFHRWFCEMLREHLQKEGVFSNLRMLVQPQLGKNFQDKGKSHAGTRGGNKRVLVVTPDILSQILLTWPSTSACFILPRHCECTLTLTFWDTEMLKTSSAQTLQGVCKKFCP